MLCSLFRITQNYITIFIKVIVQSIKLLFASIKSMNLIQKYLHIIELSACILNMFAFMFLCPIKCIILEHFQYQKSESK